MSEADRLVDEVRARYAGAALAVLDPTAPPSDALESNRRPGSDCCGPAAEGEEAAGSCCADEAVFGPELYSALEREELPDAAVMASLGCGNPTAVAELRPGETVLDLGSGGGIDVLLSARRVGPTGRAIGLDMTPEMLQLARRNAADAGVDNVEFLEGRMEAIPLPDSSVDVVISNCVVNLSTDKAAVFAELARVLRPGGRIGISDVVADDALSPAERAARGSHVGCIAGALSFAEYRAGLAAAGLDEVAVESTHSVADGMYGAIIRAVRPA
jgi:arsenite methyltransferase